MREGTTTRKVSKGLVLVILGIGLSLRLYQLSWDGGYLFHPDERQMMIVTDQVSFPWPPDWELLLSPSSPWNPSFFAYGSLPIYLLRLCTDLVGHVFEGTSTLDAMYIVGRVLSALFDTGTVYLIYRLGGKLYSEQTGLVAALLVSLTVLHIQLSHFYAVDTLLTFFVVLTVLLSVDAVRRPSLRQSVAMGIACGMALATKISAAPLLATIFLAWLFGALISVRDGLSRGSAKLASHPWLRALLGCSLTGLVALVTFIVCEPYALIDMVSFSMDVVQESYMARGVADIPYTRQYIGTLRYLYPAWQAMVWSMGIPLGLAGFSSALVAVVQVAVLIRRRQWVQAGGLVLPHSWVWSCFAVVGSFHAKFLRYMLPLIPFLCLWAAWALVSLVRGRGGRSRLRKALGIVGLAIVLVATSLYAVAFLNVYRQDHPWIQATVWLCENLPQWSRVMIEHWDDPLPLIQGTDGLQCYGDYEFIEFQGYDPDDTAKLDHLLAGLDRSDYVILSTNRLYNTIPRLPERYPLTSRYYELLLGEQLGYELVYYSAVYPQLFGVRLVNDTFSDPDLPLPRMLAEGEAGHMSINLGRADESFTVYDHPKPLVFRKTSQYSREALLTLFGDSAENLPQPESEGQ